VAAEPRQSREIEFIRHNADNAHPFSVRGGSMADQESLAKRRWRYRKALPAAWVALCAASSVTLFLCYRSGYAELATSGRKRRR